MADITVIMPSYNKEEYISEALDSVFMQETSYNYHIVVADDCSTDRTIEIVKEYQNKYPDKITLLTSETNQKLYKNVLRAYEITKTDYFCVLDPDDYWTDKHKIQKALSFLEANKDYSIYATQTMMLYKDGTEKPFFAKDREIDSDFEDYINMRATLGNTLGSVYRNTVFKFGVPEKMKHLTSPTQEQTFRGDSFRNAIHIKTGKVHFVPEFDAVYRITESGIWQSLTDIEQNLLNAVLYRDIWEYFDKKYNELLYFSWKLYKKATKDLAQKLMEITDDKKLRAACQKIVILEKTYREKEKYIDEIKNKKLNLKNKIRLFLYEKLYKKLLRKGLI